MSHKTAKTVTYKFLNTTKSDREGVRTVGSALCLQGVEPFYVIRL